MHTTTKMRRVDMKILNLYSGIGGNRKLWGNEHEVTAVEFDENIAKVYKDLFPNDNVIIGDAHQYLLDHFKGFDFIWASPPCQTHSRMRHNLGVNGKGFNPVYPDMKLYQEIIFLQHNFKGKWVVENVNPYYTPLVEPNAELDRHKFWCNFNIQKEKFVRPKLRKAQIPELQEAYGYDLSEYKLPNKRQVLRNCVLPEVGKHILDAAV
jgi:DNA (cytosine-5)-methyltransferase 1